MTFRWVSRIAPLFFFLMMLFQATASPAQAQILDWTNNGTEESCVRSVDVARGEGEVQTVEVATIQGIGCLARNFLAVATTFIGLAAFVMFIVGAFLYLTSGGQTKHIDTAKQTITYAIIGIVIALLAFFILNLLATFTGARGILRFDIFLE